MPGVIRGNVPCKAEACDIQTCLKNSGYKSDRCIDVILKLKECCEKINYASDHCASFAGLLEEAAKKKEKLK